ncbi:MAG: hypothetical protein N4A45_10555 [Flavobacteriales bacterium]|jgi:hypothetical protein|nr:hypothetical protein [Flavobacteriales bacterium]
MTTLQQQINELKAGRTLKQLKAEDKKTYYKVQGLSSKLSEQRAFEKGNFINKEHLVELKGLIIWLMKNKTNYKGFLNLKEAMTSLLNRVENEKIVFITTKGIKGIISRLAISEGLQNTEDNLRKYHDLDPTKGSYDSPILADFQQHRLDALM